MKAVYKYEVPPTDIFELDLPIGAEILSFQCQRDHPMLWALVDTLQECKITRRFRLAGTGHSIDPKFNLQYIGTCKMAEDSLIFHLFEILS
jgi:hypothetical protein